MTSNSKGYIVYAIGSLKEFSVPFPVTDWETELSVMVEKTSDDSIVSLAPTTDYTYADGKVTVTRTLTDYAAISIVRKAAIENLSSITNGMVINATTLASVLDQLFRREQETRSVSERGILVPEMDNPSSPVTLPVAAKRALSLIGFDADGNTPKMVSIPELNSKVAAA